MIGTKLAHYEITSHLGTGGMGEVYQATDAKLGRSVAIKLLPEAFTHDHDRASRFEREARLLASLNHPNIAAIHGIDESGGRKFLVMELVPGDTLADRLRRGPIPVGEALGMAAQIAEALAAAHEKGVIHRDLKPANIKVTPEGKVKVLDFGLARGSAGETAEDASNSPTMSLGMTEQGMILGTAAYMSPEQARGRAVTTASDMFAFGAVLFELLTGKQVFHGDHVSDILAAVLRAEPDWSRLPANTPPTIRRLLQRCLRKEHRQRWQSATDARIEIEEALTNTVSTGPVAATRVRPLGRWTVPAGVALLVLACGATGVFVWNLRPAPSPQPVARLVMPLPSDEQLAMNSALALSPDGTLLAYVGGADATNNRQIYTRALDTFEIKPLSGTTGAQAPFFSPDGQMIGFFAAGKLRKVSIHGGSVQDICAVARALTAAGTWGADDTIIFGSSASAGLYQVSAAGGEPRVLTTPKQGDAHVFPRLLPDGKSVLYTIVTGLSVEDATVAVHRLDTGEDRILIRGGASPMYALSGHLVYFHAGAIMAVAFDPSRLELIGSPASVLEGVSMDVSGAEFSVSSQGSLVYVDGGTQFDKSTLALVDRSGGEKALPAPSREYDDISFSPDGQRVVAQISEDAQTGGVWVYDLPRGTLTRLTFDGSVTQPAWTADGTRILYSLRKPGASGLYWKLADGSGPEERMTTTTFNTGAASASRDALAYENRTAGDIWTLPFHGERTPTPFVQTPFAETSPRFSPDGRWLAFESNESGRAEIYVQPYPGPGAKVLVSTDGGREPIWSPSGRELFFRNGDKMMALEIQTQPTLKNGAPKMLFERKGFPGGSRQWDVAPDGQHFLIVKSSEQAQSARSHINIVQNWFEELKRLAPAKR